MQDANSALKWKLPPQFHADPDEVAAVASWPSIPTVTASLSLSVPPLFGLVPPDSAHSWRLPGRCSHSSAVHQSVQPWCPSRVQSSEPSYTKISSFVLALLPFTEFKNT